jgi:hypothetical protein
MDKKQYIKLTNAKIGNTIVIEDIKKHNKIITINIDNGLKNDKCLILGLD